jgi:hypothetical protein
MPAAGSSATSFSGPPPSIDVSGCAVSRVGRAVNALGRTVNAPERSALPVGREAWRDRHMSIMLSLNFTGEALMTSRQERVVASITGALVFLGSLTDKSPRIQLLEQELCAALARIDKAAATQRADKNRRGRPGESVQAAKSVLRTKHLKPIADSGPRLLAGLPGIRESLRMPLAKASVEVHVAAAKRFAENVRPHGKAFWKAGYSRTFLKELAQAAQALAEAADDPTSVIAAYTKSTGQLGDEIRDARALIKELDSAFMTEWRRDDPQTKNWQRAKRVPARLGRPPRKSREKPQ